MASRPAIPELTATTASLLICGPKAKTTPRMMKSSLRWKKPAIRWCASS